MLRKDFLYEPYQVDEARALGADCILIIMAGVTDDEAHALEDAANALGMDVLVEVHDEPELERALAPLARASSASTTATSAPSRPRSPSPSASRRWCPPTASSSARAASSPPPTSPRLAEAGIDTFLVGESLMREADVAAATARLLGVTVAA